MEHSCYEIAAAGCLRGGRFRRGGWGRCVRRFERGRPRGRRGQRGRGARILRRDFLQQVLQGPHNPVEDESDENHSRHEQRRARHEPPQELREDAAPAPHPLAVDFPRGGAHDGGGDGANLFRVAHEQRPVAYGVDHARNPARELVDCAHRLAVKLDFAAPARHVQPVRDVLQRLRFRERLQVVTRRNPLIELAQLLQREHFGQFRLADQNNLKQLVLLGFEVGQEPDLFEHRRRQVLRLVNDEHAVAAPRRGIEQVLVQRVHQFQRRIRGAVDAELPVDLFQQFDSAQRGVEDEGDVCLRVELIQQIAADSRLACADLARQHHEPAVVLDAVEQVRESLLVLVAQIQKLRIRRQVKGLFSKTVEYFVHANLADMSRRAKNATPAVLNHKENTASPGADAPAAPQTPGKTALHCHLSASSR